MRNETVLEAFDRLQIVERSQSLESAFKMLAYALELTNYVEDEGELKKISCHITDGIECFQEYQEKTTDNIEELRRVIEAADAPDRADAADVPEDVPDYEKIEHAALDTDRARATIGCIIAALHDKGGDNIDIKIDGTSCWQVREALEGVYKILEDTALIFYEVSELIERQSR